MRGVAHGHVCFMAEAHCDHEWTLINRDENRLIYKCLTCGDLKYE